MKRPTDLYACIYVREFPSQALLRLRPNLNNCACVVMDGEPPFEEVCSLNTKARLLGIQRGMRRTDVDAFPEAKILRRSSKMELAARQMLLECAGKYSPRIEDRSGALYFLCAIDIAGTEHLFGPPKKLACQLLGYLQSLGLSARLTISTNFHTAACVAKGTRRHSITVIPLGEEAAALSELPINVLPLTDQQSELFALWGIKTLGMLAALPDDELVARIGQDGRTFQQLARGELPHLFQPVEPTVCLVERQELEFPIELLDSLMFGIAVMLDSLIMRATIQLVALACVNLVLELDNGATHTSRVRPAQPGNDKHFWLRLLHLDLQAHPPQAAVVAVKLEADPGNSSKIQFGLFSPPLPEPARLDVTLAQLKALLGEENVGYPILHDSHAPERFRIEPFSVPCSNSVSRITNRRRSSARFVRPSEALLVNVHNSHPKAFLFREQYFIVEHAYGPWTLGSEWWNESHWNIQQWDLIAATLNGPPFYCCVILDLLRDEWRLTAIYD